MTPDLKELRKLHERARAFPLPSVSYILDAFFNALPFLLDELERLTAENSRMREALTLAENALACALPAVKLVPPSLGRDSRLKAVDAALSAIGLTHAPEVRSHADHTEGKEVDNAVSG